MIGRPGAERILSELGHHAVLGFDSNALRCLLRMGYGRERKSYAASYVSAQEAATVELPLPAAGLTEASRLLRHHGLQTCRRIIPRCDGCAVRHLCAHGKGITPR
jgi:endonuclease III